MAEQNYSAYTTSSTPSLVDYMLMLDSSETDPNLKLKLFATHDLLGFLPDGTLLNGKIAVTVASNNITLTLKTLAGSTPTSDDIVYVKINGTWRSVSSALSVTVNAGTNSFNAGATELATKAVDYFAYLAYRTASTAVVIGFARFPWASLYSDFSGTATNEKYGAFSTAPASTDDCVNIGRFEATNSGTASYNWSVPTFTSDNLKLAPTFSTRRLSWVPTHTRSITGYTNAPTVSDAYYIISDRRLKFFERHTQNGTPGGSGNQTMTLPFSNGLTVGQKVECVNATSAVEQHGIVAGSGTTITLYKYDGTAEATASQVYLVNGELFA